MIKAFERGAKLVSALRPMHVALGQTVTLRPPDEEGDAAARDLARDLFFQMFTVLPLRDYVPERVVNKRLIEYISSTHSWEEAVSQTRGSIMGAAAAASIMAEYLLKNEEVKRALEEQEKAEKQMRSAIEDGNWRDAKKIANNLQASADALIQSFTKSPANAAGIYGALGRAKEAAEAANQLGKAWGLGPGGGMAVDWAPISKIMQKMSPDGMRRFAEAVGRAKGAALKNISKRRQNMGEYECGYTREFFGIFPSGLLALLSPKDVGEERHLIALAEYGARGLLGLRKVAEEEREGGLIFLVDGSGSMEGEREYMAKAVAIGLGLAAKENGQPWWGAVFGGEEEITDWVSNDSPPEKMAQFTSFMFGGGTDFDHAIARAIELIEREEEKRADVVFITDGEAKFSADTLSAWEKVKEKYGTRLVIVSVEAGEQEHLQEIADAVVVVTQPEDIDAAANAIARSIWKE